MAENEVVEQQQPVEKDWKKQAEGMGWREDFEGAGKLDPKAYVQQKERIQAIKKLESKVRRMEDTIRSQQTMQEQLLARQREEILTSLKNQKIQAIEESNAAKVVAIDDQIDKVKSAPIQNPNQPSHEFIEWSSNSENSWYNDDDDMRSWADAYGLKLYQQNPRRPMPEIFADISRRVKDVFPHKFENPTRARPSAVESGATRSEQKQEGETRIPREYRDVFHTMWKSGAWGDKTMGEAAKLYAKDLAKIGALKEE